MAKRIVMAYRLLPLSYATKLFLFVTLSFHNKGYTQNTYNFENLTQENGISQGTGYAATQHDGFMWFATQDGLNRYDGYNFKVYRAGGRKNINSNFVQTLLTDSKGRLWVGTTGGLNIHDKINDNFQKFAILFNINHLLDSVSIEKLIEDKKGNIWVMTDEKGIFCINSSTKQIKHFFPNNNTFYGFSLSPNGKLWLSSYNEVYYFDETIENFKPIQVKKQLHLSGSVLVQDIVIDLNNDLWISIFQKGVYVLKEPLSKSNFEYFSKGVGSKNIADNEVRCMFKSKDGRIWLGTKSGGISLFDFKSRTFTHIKKTEGNPRSLGENFIMSIYQDQQNIIWFGLGSSGFSKYDPLKFPFQLIQHQENRTSEVYDNMIFCIHGNSDGLYFGTNKSGLSYLSSQTKRFTNYLNDLKNPKGILHNEINDISSTENRYLWLATTIGVCRLDKTTQTFKYYLQNQKKSQPYYLYAIHKTSFGEVWAGGQSGLDRLDLKTEKWKSKKEKHPTQAFADYTIRLFYEDSRHKIWIGTIGHALIYYDPVAQKTITFDKKNGLDCSNIRSILEDKQTLWVGTDCGLFSIDLLAFKIKKHISSKHQNPAFRLINDVVYGVLNDENGFLWLSTNQGITQLSLQKGIVKNYDVKDGLQSNEFNTNCVFKRNDSTLFFGGVKGINYFKPNQLKKNTFIPPLKITQIKIIDSLYNPNQRQLRLNYEQNFIEFEFAALNFSNTQKNQYQYQLLGVDKTWVNAGNKTFANYTKLAPGKYTFLLRGSNSDDVWNPNPASVFIEIVPPLWGYWWFAPAIWLLLFLLCGMGYYFYLSYELRNKHKVQNIRNQIAADLHDEVGSTLNSIAISSNFIQGKLKNISPQIRQTLQQIKIDADETVVNIRDTVWALNPDNDSLEKLVEKIRSFAFQLLTPLGVEVFFQNDILNNKANLSPEQRKNLFLITKEVINNIAKYAGASNVFILFDKNHETLIVEIKDNGRGFDNQIIYEGNGLKNIQKRANESKFDLKIDSKIGIGTTILLKTLKI